MVRLSAKRKVLTEGIIWIMASFMAIRNRMTLRTEPCGTPFCISTECELVLVRTFMRRVLIKFSMNVSILPCRPRILSLEINCCLHTMSYAFSRSKATITVLWLVMNSSHMLASMFISPL